MRGLVYWYRGPWKWTTTDDGIESWSPPAGCVGGLDLRSLPDQVTKERGNGLGIFWGVQPPAKVGSDYDLLGTGGFADIKESQKLKDMIPSRRKYRIEGDNLKRMLMNLLTDGSDPSGGEFAKPIMPDSQGFLDLRIGGQQVREIYRHGKHRHTNRVLDVIQHDMSEVIAEAESGKLRDREHHRRVLDAYCDKFKLKGADDWKQFVKSDQRKKIKGRLKHETIYTDDFNRASLGSGWTNVDGTLGIDGSTQVTPTVTFSSGYPASCRFESDLSSSDHYSKFVRTSSESAQTIFGPAVRFSASAETFYMIGYRSLGSISNISKTVSGLNTALVDTSSGSDSPPDTTLRIQANGSSISGLANGVEFASVTDTAITGNLRCGLVHHVAVGSLGDDFECGDLSATAGRTIVNLERDIERGIDRGLHFRRT